MTARLVTTNASLITRTFKSDLKIKWIRPEKVSCLHPSKSGDRQAAPEVDKSQVDLKYQLSEELKK